MHDCDHYYRPCILIFDSLVGCSRNRVMATLRDYLQIEYQVKKTETEKELSDLDRPTLFTKETMPGSCLKVPQQNNYSDCGVYVLQYAESFMKVKVIVRNSYFSSLNVISINGF